MRRRGSKAKSIPKAGPPIEVMVTALGHKGDGVADGPNGPLYVPYTVAGDRVRGRPITDRLTEVEVLEGGPDRVTPPCPHFGRCGGCSLQHVERSAYLDFKRDLIVNALAQRGLQDVPVDATIAAPPASRRRVVFKAKRHGARLDLGFNAPRSHQCVGISECHILTPALQRALPPLRAFLTAILQSGQTATLYGLDCDNGLDLDIRDCDIALDLDMRDTITTHADRLDAARISWSGEPIIERRRPVVRLGDAHAHPPPSIFVQASRDGEAALVKTVCGYLADCDRVADLFAGIGTFTFPLADRSAVRAFELDSQAVDSLTKTRNQFQAPRPIEIERRDLFRRPLTVKELKKIDGVVFDPPRAGATDQSAELTKSSVARVAAVSCNPATFARDARLLVDGGFTLLKVIPVDQFVWSSHIECVGLFER